MSQSIDIKELWNRREVQPPDIHELYQRTIKFKRQKLRVLLLNNLILVLTCAFIIFVWAYYQPQFITTKVGIVIIIGSIVMHLFVNNRMLPVLLKANQQESNSVYLQTLLKLKERQKLMLHTFLNIYFVLLSTGLCLYMYEYTSRMTFLWGTLTYAILFLWIGLNWFYFRPLSIRKQEAKLDDLIGKFRSMSNQL